ncbi:MAG TPA: ABC transporter ATP-binding protein [Alphaproteobacteria bacterium]|jgi:iron(III) transport system ATP-binding protein
MIEVKGLTKTYAGGNVKAVDGVDFEVEAGKIFTLLGPSGCGKTTSLRSVAGLERPDVGEIRLSGETVFSSERDVCLHPSKRSIGMVFQSYAIWPHMTVLQNVAYPLKGKGLSGAEISRKAHEALHMVGLEGFEDRPAPRLSGGQQQRVALARAVASDPRIFLFDEPLSNLDAKLREEMRGQIRDLQRKLGITSLYVTHDQIEALSISDYIAVMEKGRIVEVGAPRDIYLHPTSRFAAQFVGLTNIMPAKLLDGANGAARVELPFASLLCAGKNSHSHGPGAELMVLLRPENVRVSSMPFNCATNEWRGRVVSSVFLGEFIDCTIACGDFQVRARVNPFNHFDDGAEVYLHIPPERFSLLTA